MPLQRKTARNVVVTAPRRQTTWYNRRRLITHTAAAEIQATELTHPAISSGFQPGGTCLRLIMEIRLRNSATVHDAVTFGVGVVVVTADALAVPSAVALPDPMADEEQDWYYWWTGEVSLSDEGLLPVKIDIRSARKFRGGYRLVLLTENVIAELTTEVSIMARTLWMMP